MKWAVFDTEADGLVPTKFYCLSYDTGEIKKSITDYNEMRGFLKETDVIIGHNILLFDVPNLERILEVKYSGTVIDTLVLSWYLYNERDRHGIESWGEELGIPKPEITDWLNLSLEEYIFRCESDREITKRLWDKQVAYLKMLYPDPKEFWRFIDYLMKKVSVVRGQEETKWKLDTEFCESELIKLEEIEKEKIQALKAIMPPVPIITKKHRPKTLRKANGELSAHGLVWYALLKENSLRDDYDGSIDVIKGYEDPNPNSSAQIKDYLFSLGWEPRTFKYNKDGKAIPQINKERGEGLCESVKDLFEKSPDLVVLDSLSVISHRMGLLKGFLRDQEDGFLKAKIIGLTNTLRFKHQEIVNLPKIGTNYSEGIRNSLVASDDDHELCGSDQKSLEDRLKQHYIYPYDPEYVKEMQKDDFDPHLDLAGTAHKLSATDIEAYKKGDRTKKKTRDIFKNGNYACQYGAGPPKLVLTCGITLPEAKELHEAYWERNWAIKEVAKDQKVRTINDQLWLLNPVSKFWYPLRNMKDIFSTLVQGTASYVFDLWVFEITEVKSLTGQFHDEIIINVRKGYRDQIKSFLQNCIDTVNKKLKLNRLLEIDVQFGNRYGEIH